MQIKIITDGGDFMKRKSGFVFGGIGVLALSIGFTNVLAKEPMVVSGEDRIRVVTVEEQELYENRAIESKNLEIVITAEEQNRVENSTALSGFVTQENGQGFYFIKEK